jgi:methionyl-tRNA formyltransferase
VRVLFLGSPPFATPILSRLASGPHQLAGVVTQPDRPRGRGREAAAPGENAVARQARECGAALFQPVSARDAGFLAAARALAPDVSLVASYGEILGEDFLSIALTLNVHASLLPRWRGASPVQAAILAGDRGTGVTLQRVVRALDAGDVLLSRATPIGDAETAGELSARLAALGAAAAAEALDLVAAGKDRYAPQDPAAVTRCSKLGREDGHLDWIRPARELERRVRAMNPWPLAHTALPGGAHLAVHRAVPGEDGPPLAPGTLREAGARLTVACGPDGRQTLELLEVQAAGKRALDAASFLCGARLAAGARLEAVERGGRGGRGGRGEHES